MMRSLYSGVAGLKTHQTKMDVIGNNIANVNTQLDLSRVLLIFQTLFIRQCQLQVVRMQKPGQLV